MSSNCNDEAVSTTARQDLSDDMILNTLQGEGNYSSRFLYPTFASAVHESSQHETEIVANSFKVGCFRSIKSLPSKIQSGHIRADKMQTIIRHKLAASENSFKPPQPNKCFQPLQYSSTDYGKLEQIVNAENELKRLNLQSFSRKPFSYNSMRTKMKYEDIFEDKRYKYPGLAPIGDLTPLEVTLRTDLHDPTKFAAGPFRASLSKALVEREKVTNWCKNIHKRLAEDWAHLRFHIKYTKNEEILIQFDINLITEQMPLRRYMDYLSVSGLGAEYHLYRRGDRWAVVEDTSLVFSMYVPWVAGRVLRAMPRSTISKKTGKKSDGYAHSLTDKDEYGASAGTLKVPSKWDVSNSSSGVAGTSYRPSSRESNFSTNSESF